MRNFDQWTEGLSRQIVKGLRNFDQWTEGLSKQIVLRSEEGGMKGLWKSDKAFFGDDGSEEEE
jgi:hypothetical protein